MSFQSGGTMADWTGKNSRRAVINQPGGVWTDSKEILKLYAHQQAIVAALGQKALSGVSLEALIEDALMLLSDGLRLEFGSIWEFVPTKDRLTIKAEIGWRKNAHPSMLKTKQHTPVSAALNFQTPIILNNVREEKRFIIPPVLVSNQILSGICVSIRNSAMPYGVIGLYTAKLRRFSSEDIYFLQSVANVLGMTIGRKKTEGLLLESNRQLQASQTEHKREQTLLAAIVESSDDAIFSKDLEGRITSWNTGAEKLYGYQAGQIIGQHVSKLFPKDRILEFVSIMEIIRLGESVDHLETVRIGKDGRQVDVAVTVSPLRDRNGQIVGASAIDRDISLNKELERRKDAFIGMASHELKTPITSMKAFAQVIQKRLEQTQDDKSIIFLNKLNHQVNRLADLVSDLLNLSKIEAGKLELKKERFGIGRLVEDTIFDVQNAYPTHRIELVGNVSDRLVGDKDRISQILINLLTNAIKYSPGKDRVVVEVSSGDSKVTMSVRDFGIGIDKEHLDRIFDRFFRAEGLSEKTFPGLGIGLYITSELVKRHGGHIWVESEKGAGTTFHVTLPIK